MATSNIPTALIVGASRGLGLGLAKEYLARGWQVIATVRATAKTALHDVQADAHGRLEIEHVDINEPHQVAALHVRLHNRSLDLLFVSAGISTAPDTSIGQVDAEEFAHEMTNNALSPMHFIEMFHDLVQPKGSIVVMSSGLGSIANNTDGGWETYRASKAALNTLMRSFVARQTGDPRTYLLMDPGWVRTDMGGPDATLGVEESVPRMADVVEAEVGKGGLRFCNYRGQTVAW
ncbi:SDR family NAD(P)-dependent oxidoreductase [Dyella choica]|uniref:SDR family NAD(P)-dependent oxidoreductase n=1 Tax=Dyella choica TaxID=1927959 RepID=A0A3S0RM14_9GAMM|nr:SDR family NAD(P)-dependent oxidoreductase [Dyella choica]RUL78134.1 SDR family NAD(P)-dependent oxidoreductase [Dyella choica]